MFSIGEFSKATSLTIKTLRYYHNLGLLLPSKIDEYTGYRYYSEQSFDRVNIINALKGMGFTLYEVKSIISYCENEKDLNSYIASKLLEIDEKVKQLVAHKKRLHHFKELLKSERHGRMEIKEIEVKPILAAGIKLQGRYDKIANALFTMMKQIGGIIQGKPFCLHYDLEYKEGNAHFMPCFEVKRSFKIKGINCFTTRGGKAVALTHKGPYNTLGKAYLKLFQYNQEKKYSLALPIMERYIKGPGIVFRGNPRNYLTEIIIFIEN